ENPHWRLPAVIVSATRTACGSEKIKNRKIFPKNLFLRYARLPLTLFRLFLRLGSVGIVSSLFKSHRGKFLQYGHQVGISKKN
ncbi:hypothetical protein, partial [Flavobacterium agri]|uniref:hypothetical protein n=1 Tax=Flavobacterium agri TaxID=2743471 RepID=UPI001C3755AB